MIKLRRDVERLGYGWVCPKCFRGTDITNSTPLQCMDLKMMDLCLQLFHRGFQPMGEKAILSSRSDKSVYF
jgi:hypothetical protein